VLRADSANVCYHFIALPITIGSVRYPDIKIHETRIIRLMEVLLHGGTRHARRRLDGQGDPSGLTTFEAAADTEPPPKARSQRGEM